MTDQKYMWKPKYDRTSHMFYADIKYRPSLKGEASLQNLVCLELARLCTEGRMIGKFFHPKNDFHYSSSPKEKSKQIAFAKCLGLLPGVADLVIFRKDKILFIELKHMNGQLNSKQMSFQKFCNGEGIPYYVCRSLKEVLQVLEDQCFLF